MNLYAYVNGDPVNATDPSGEIPLVLVPVFVGALSQGGFEALDQYSKYGEIRDGGRIIGAAAIGGFGGLVGYGAGGLATQLVAGSATKGGAFIAGQLVGASAGCLAEGLVNMAGKHVTGLETAPPPGEVLGELGGSAVTGFIGGGLGLGTKAFVNAAKGNNTGKIIEMMDNPNKGELAGTITEGVAGTVIDSIQNYKDSGGCNGAVTVRSVGGAPVCN